MKLGIIQARLGSTRLPGKIFKKINGQKLLALMLARVASSKHLDKVVIATSTESGDDPIAEFCDESGVECFRGSEDDVLERFFQAVTAQPETPELIVRMTSDCPLHHGEVVDFAIEQFLERKVDYFSNSNHPPVLEDGCDAEVFSFSALKSAHEQARLSSQREHVTPYIKDSGKFTCAWQKFHPGWQYKLSVDGPKDFEAISAIFQHFSPNILFPIDEIVKLMETDEKIRDLNADSVINAGYQKSLDNDKFVK